MALQDLTPQLRTRLSRLERTVGLFVGVATLLLLAALVFYIQQTAKRKGWFDKKLPYYTFVHTGAGLKVGDPVRLMGFEVGQITRIEAQPPEDSYFDVFIAFEVKAPYFGYLWEDSRAKVGAADFLGKRFIELTKGINGPATYLFHPVLEVTLDDASSLLGDTNVLFFAEEVYDQFKTNLLAGPTTRFNKTVLDEIFRANSVTSIKLTDKGKNTKHPAGLWDFKAGQYRSPDENEETRKGYFMVPDEAPALTERLEAFVTTAEAALPNILDLTNHLQRVLVNAGNTAARADDLLANARPLLNNLTSISANLSDPQGSLGEWIIPPDLARQLKETIASANAILTNSDSRITELASDLDLTLENLAGITGNLRAQVNANTNIVSEVSRLIIDTDDMVQGLKRHWLLRSAFKRPPTNAPPARTRDRRNLSPNDPRTR